MLKMYELINAGNNKVLKNISIFINTAFELRNSTMYDDMQKLVVLLNGLRTYKCNMCSVFILYFAFK